MLDGEEAVETQVVEMVPLNQQLLDVRWLGCPRLAENSKKALVVGIRAVKC